VPNQRRRENKLEEEHSEIEFKMRILMNKTTESRTESDDNQEELLMQRLLEVIEERNEIVENMMKIDKRYLLHRRSEAAQAQHDHNDSFIHPFFFFLSTFPLILFSRTFLSISVQVKLSENQEFQKCMRLIGRFTTFKQSPPNVVRFHFICFSFQN
jgi:hypothetical protein